MERSAQLKSRLLAARFELTRLRRARDAAYETLKCRALQVEEWLEEQVNLHGAPQWGTLTAARISLDEPVGDPPVRHSLFWTQAHELAWEKLSQLQELLVPYVRFRRQCRDKSLAMARMEAAWRALRRLEGLDES